MSVLTIVGIDPGKSGAMSIVYGDGAVQCFDVPHGKVNGKNKPLFHAWASSWAPALEFAAPDLIVIERVNSMPGQGVTSMFSFGQTLGFVHAIACLSGARVEFVTPSVWKGKMGLLNSGKDASREKFRTLWPKHAALVARVKDDGRAEAALLAHYGRKFL